MLHFNFSLPVYADSRVCASAVDVVWLELPFSPVPPRLGPHEHGRTRESLGLDGAGSITTQSIFCQTFCQKCSCFLDPSIATLFCSHNATMPLRGRLSWWWYLGVQAAGGVASDRFLQSQVFSQDEINEAGSLEDRLTVLYFLKVIHLFEQFGYYGKCIRNVMTSSIQNSFIVPLTIVEIKDL